MSTNTALRTGRAWRVLPRDALQVDAAVFVAWKSAERDEDGSMNEDRNKTALTKHVTAAAIAYLDERGCKPIETEVAVEPGWRRFFLTSAPLWRGAICME